MRKTNPQPESVVSAEIEKIVEDGQRLIRYIARDGKTELDPKLIQVIIDAKYKLAEKSWSQQDERDFLISYDQLTQSVYPVTVESIDAILPRVSNKKHVATRAEAAVAWYRRCTLFALLLLILTQVYWLLGNELRNNLQQIFDNREQTQLSLHQTDISDSQKEKLQAQLKIDNQKLDANYKMLLSWNKVWSMGGKFEDSLPQYFQAEYEQKKKLFEQQQQQQELDKLELTRSLHQVRITFFKHILSADFILISLQHYLLPLLYGLLGAFIYVLRDLLREIRQLTYTFDSEIRYRLRLTLGALAGMIIGWFLKAEEAGAVASLSPMAMAFLMGYNVDVLFALMDKLIDNLKQAINKPATTTTSNKAP